MSKYYKTIIEVEVLSEDPYNPEELEQIAADITTGDCSGKWTISSSEEVSKEKMTELLIAQGSDPEFLIREDEDEEDFLRERMIKSLIAGDGNSGESQESAENMVENMSLREIKYHLGEQ